MGHSMTVTIQQDPNVTNSDTPTHRYLIARYWYGSTASVQDSTNDFSTSGDFPNVTNQSVNINISTSGGKLASQMIREVKLTVAKTYGSSKSIYAAGWIKGIEYWGTGNQAYGNTTYTVPARAYTAPSAPGRPSVSSVTSSSFYASWAAPSNWGGDNTADYDVQYSKNSNFSGATTATIYNKRNHTVTGLDPNTTYYVRVRAFNAAGRGSWSTSRTLSTAVATPSRVPQPAVSGITDSGFTASWNDPSSWGGENTSDFRLQVSTNSSFSSASTYTVSNANSRALTGLSPNTTYYVRVRAFNSAGNGSWSSSRSAKTSARAPSAVSGLSVSAVGSTQATLSWASPSDWGGNNTGTYRVEVHDNSAYTSLVNGANVSSRSRTVQSLTPGVQYWWRVRPYNSGGNGGWVNGSSFATQGAPTIPLGLTVVSPGPIGATLSWSPPASWGGDSSGYYVFAYRRVGDSEWITATTSPPQYVIPTTLQPNATYEWTVQAVNSFGSGPYADPMSFGTSAPPVYTKVSGAWRPTVAVRVKSNGAWRSTVRTWVKVSGAWR